MRIRKCCVPNCNDKSSRRHRFPNPRKHLERFQIWINKIQNSTLIPLDPITVYKNKTVCHSHFETQFFSIGATRLHLNAIPTLYLPTTTSESTFTAASEISIQPSSDDLINYCFTSADNYQRVPQTSFTPELQEDALPSTYKELASNKNTEISNLHKEHSFKSKDMNAGKIDIISVNDNQLLEDTETGNRNFQKYIRTMDVKDINKVCRTCMNSADIMVPILESVLQNEIKLVDILLECASVQVKSSDCLPLNICNNCLDEILRIHSFRKQCTDVEQSLKELLLNAPKLTKPLDDHNYCTLNSYEQIESNVDEQAPQEEAIISKQKAVIKSKPKKIVIKTRKSRSNREFTCRDCEKSFIMRIDLLAHLKEAKHSELPYWKCELCQKSFKMKSRLKLHMRSHTKEKPYQCKLCISSFSLGSNLHRHIMDVHNRERSHICQYCGKSFAQLETLKKHEQTHKDTDAISLTCKYCDRSFSRNTFYLKHLKMHGINNKQEELITEIEAKEAEISRHVCEVCKKRFKHKYSLNFHLIRHSEKLIKCSDCGKSFYTKDALKKHLIVHTGEKPFTTHSEKLIKCGACGRSFYTKAALKLHLIVHTGEKPFTCTICSKSFTQSGSLNLHMQIHSGFKPHQCHLCLKSFIQMQHLKYHLLKHNGIREYACNYCDKTFFTKSSLIDHIRTHTKEITYFCTVCEKGFYCRSSLRKHKKNHENENKLVSSTSEEK